MRWGLSMAGIAALLTLCRGGAAGDAFVAGDGMLPAESFGPVEGVVLLFLAAAATVAFFGLLMVARRGHRRLSDTLDGLLEKIAGKEGGR